MAELKVGETYSSFTLLDVTYCPDYNGTGYYFRHKSGFEVYYFSSDDEESFFSYNVYTPAFDNSGVFHILEHTVLTGSRRYPVRDPFMDIDRNSVNTFLNAMTGPDRTYYPAASPVKKDFDNIFSVYTDAVFNPLLRKDSFMQEGIRVTHSGFEGVVFSEMGGDVTNHSSVVFNTSNRFLFSPGSPYRFESGGDPVDIVDLTYEKFIETYRKYYVPANITLFLYGKIDILEKLEKLDMEYLSNRDSGRRIERPRIEEPWKGEKSVKAYSDAEDGDEGATVSLSWRLGEASGGIENTILSLIVDTLLGNPGCPLYKAVIDSGLGKDISSEGGMNDSYASLTFAVGISGVKEDDGERVRDFLISSLEKIVKDGIDPVLIESTLRRMEFSLREIKEGTPNGYRIFFKRIDKGWAYGQSPSSMLFPGKEIEYIRSELKKNPRFIEDWIKTNLIDNPTRLLSTVVMDGESTKRREKEIKRKLKEKMAFYKREDEEAYLRRAEEEESEEAVKSLPRLSLSDVPVKKTTIPREEVDSVLISPLLTNGIVYADFVFDVSDFTLEELEYVSLLSRMLTMTNVGSLSYSEFLTRLRFSTGAFSSLFESGTTCDDKEKDFLLIRFKSLREHYGESLSLIHSLLLDGDFSSPERIKAVLRDIQSDFESSITREAHLFALSSASRSFSPALYTAERTQGISFWLRVVELLKEDSALVGERVGRVARKVFGRNRITFHVVCEKDDVAEVGRLSSSFISSLPVVEKGEYVKKDLRGEEKNIAYTLSSPVSYTSLVFKAPDPLSKITGPMRVFLSLLSRSMLWRLEREKGGAYGSGASLDINENTAFFYTYRDPRLDASLDDFIRAVESETLTEEKLEDTKLRVLSREVKPTGPQSRGLVDLRRYLYSISDDLRWTLRDAMLSVTLPQLEKARAEILSLIEKRSAVSVITSPGSLKKSSLKAEKIKLPFSTVN